MAGAQPCGGDLRSAETVIYIMAVLNQRATFGRCAAAL